MNSIRVVISLKACYGLRLYQLNVKNAFLYRNVNEGIYMEQPHGYVSHVHPEYVCKIMLLFVTYVRNYLFESPLFTT